MNAAACSAITRAVAAVGDALSRPPFTAAVESLTPNLGGLETLLRSAAPIAMLDVAGRPFATELAFDHARYALLDSLGDLTFVALRDAAGNLAGAFLGLVQTHPHFRSTVTAMTDVFTVTPGAAAVGGAIPLFEATKAALQARGATRWIVGERFDTPHVLPLAQIGFAPVEVAHTMALEPTAGPA